MMKAKRLIISLCYLVLTLFCTVVYAENISVNKNWENTLGKRSVLSSSTLVKEGNIFLSNRTKF